MGTQQKPSKTGNGNENTKSKNELKKEKRKIKCISGLFRNGFTILAFWCARSERSQMGKAITLSHHSELAFTLIRLNHSSTAFDSVRCSSSVVVLCARICLVFFFGSILNGNFQRNQSQVKQTPRREKETGLN